MKKIAVSLISLVFALSLMGCPDITTLPLDWETSPISEMLFDLPDQASFVSETFEFTLMKPEYSNVNDMQVKGTYIIQNDGDDATMEMLYTSIKESTFYESTYTDLSLNVRVNHMEEDMQWTFSNDPENQLAEEEISYDVFEKYVVRDIADPYTVVVHKYKFDCPKAGYDEEMTLLIPDDTYILYSSYMKKIDDNVYMNIQDVTFDYQGEETIIPAFSNETYLTIYTIENQIEFSTNYDFNGVHEITNLASVINIENGSTYQAKYLIYSMEKNREEGILSSKIEDYMYNVRFGDNNILDILTLSVNLPGNGAQTTVEVTFPRISYGTHVEENIRYLLYDFYLDTKRYDDDDIPITLILNTDYDIVSNTLGVTDTLTVSNISSTPQLRFEFSTDYEDTEES